MSHFLRLIYASRASDKIVPEELEVLVTESRVRNQGAGITGILCYGRGYFVQALEGPETGVVSLYGSVLRDSRHKQCRLLSIGLVSFLAFPRWAMNLVEGEPLGPDLHDRLLDKVLLDRDPSEPVKLLQEALKPLRKAS